MTRLRAAPADQPPQDAVAFMNRAIRVLAAITVAAILIVLTVGCGPIDVEVTAAQVSAADELKANVLIEDRVLLLARDLQPVHPLPYAVRVRDCLPSGRECTRERYYIPRSAP